MNTLIKKVRNTAELSNDPVIKEAGRILKNGGLVAFPTETVYGLGANALSLEASGKIYAAKGRPSDNPLIAHIADIDMLESLVYDISEKARLLMEAFWPGPMTLIFKKKDIVPYATTGGLNTVAIRMPSNNIARALIRQAGVPIAAPSANKSGRPSPTMAEHVKEDLYGVIDMIIDDGPTDFGLESTIIDVSEEEPVILRPGAITDSMVQNVLGKISSSFEFSEEEGEGPKAPGMKYKHYAPKAKMILLRGNQNKIISTINQLSAGEKNFALMITKELQEQYQGPGRIYIMGKASEPETIGANIFKLLRQIDADGCELVFTEGIEEKGIGIAVMNRLKKACGYNIVDV
ncbi:MAG: threonylcarbamoyl-AMP synthase [Lachnospiraceae bacterium]|nr:threonylcarbamoyl-AMP synthase [Lachnospiraceae bacterium]